MFFETFYYAVKLMHDFKNPVEIDASEQMRQIPIQVVGWIKQRVLEK